jgi:hypothetical protein
MRPNAENAALEIMGIPPTIIDKAATDGFFAVLPLTKRINWNRPLAARPGKPQRRFVF